MQIAQVSPLYESVPPKCYGGTERVVSYLTEALVRLGHEVTLFASADSVTQSQLVACSQKSLRLDTDCIDTLPHHVYELERVAAAHDQFDIIHNHLDYLAWPILRRLPTRHVTTLHGRLDLPDLRALWGEFAELPLVSISLNQRNPFSHRSWAGTVYHGIPADLYEFQPEPGKYLAFIGRICPENRVDAAIRLARQSGIPLKIAAKVDRVDREYFATVIKPLLDGPSVEFVGEITDQEKRQFLSEAIALVFPIDWPEPFGLAMIEALACGVPVIARRRGSVPEVIDHGVTGFIGEHDDQLLRYIGQVETLSRQACRREFEERFTDTVMAQRYLQVYQRLLAVDSDVMEESTLPALGMVSHTDRPATSL